MQAGAGLVGRGGLLRGGDGDLGDHAIDALGHADDALESFAGLVGGDDSLLYGSGAALHAGDGSEGAVLNALDHAGDLAGGLCGGFGETADLSGDYGEATALIAGASGLDGGVEGEEIRLAGDLVDDGDDLRDAPRVVAEEADGGRGVADRSGDGVHAAEDLLDDGAAFAGCFSGAASGFGGGLGVAGDLGDGGRHLLHGGGGLLGLLTLLVHAAMDLVAGRAHGGGAAGDGGDGLSESADDAGEIGLHLLDGVGEGAGLIGGVQDQRLSAEVAGGDGVGAVHDHVQGMGDLASKIDRYRDTDERGDDRAEPEDDEGEVIGFAKVRLLLVGEAGLRLGDLSDIGEQGIFERQNLVLQRVVCCGRALRGL